MQRKFLLALLVAATTQATMAQTRPDIEPIARTCNGCHGIGGVSVGYSMPSIGGLPREYLKQIMKQWKYGERTALTMDRIVKGYSDDQLDALADYFSKQPWVPSPQPAAGTVLAKGKQVAQDNCRDCHGLRGGDPDVGVPKINGQWAKYMELELVKYRSGDFKMPHRKMKQAARDMKGDDVSSASRYYGAQGK